MPRKPSGEYDVGYGKPPRHTRFQPGRSGNPNGRPKKDTSWADVLDRVMDRKIALKENGKARKVPVTEAVFLRLVQDALAGKTQSMKLLLDLKGQADSRPKAPVRTPPAGFRKLLAELDQDTLMKLRTVAAKAAREASASPETEESS